MPISQRPFHEVRGRPLPVWDCDGRVDGRISARLRVKTSVRMRVWLLRQEAKRRRQKARSGCRVEFDPTAATLVRPDSSCLGLFSASALAFWQRARFRPHCHLGVVVSQLPTDGLGCFQTIEDLFKVDGAQRVEEGQVLGC